MHNVGESMKHNLKLIIFSLVYFLSTSNFLLAHDTKKIVGLIQIRNEETYIKQCLDCLIPYVDALVILDDASTDETVNIIKTLKKSLPIKVIIENEKSAWETGNESENKQKLLDAGRSIGGTHFICIDADEIFTADCMENNYLRNQILALKPGQSRMMRWIQLWRSTDQFNVTHISKYKPIIFCDNHKAEYSNAFLHGCNLPQNLEPFSILDTNYGLLHFQFVNWRNLLIKHAWYRCLERIRKPQKSIPEINTLYGNTINETNVVLKPCPKSWFEGYTLFDPLIYEKPIVWREEQVLTWFDNYGQDFFEDLEIWNIDWGNGIN